MNGALLEAGKDTSCRKRRHMSPADDGHVLLFPEDEEVEDTVVLDQVEIFTEGWAGAM